MYAPPLGVMQNVTDRSVKNGTTPAHVNTDE